MNEKRGSWYLLTGLALGLILGLVFSLWISPVEFERTAPKSLGSTYKNEYRVLIALAFEANGDMGRALARLSLLQDDNPASVLAAQAQHMLSEGGSAEEASALVALSDAIQAQNGTTITPSAAASDSLGITALPAETIAAETATPDPEHAILTPTSAPTQAPASQASLTPRATALPDELSNASFTLDEQREVCDSQTGELLLQIEVLDKNGLPLAGIPIQVSWQDGEETFYTGLHPQVSPGYADFTMQPDVVYSVRAGVHGQVESGITAVDCTSEDDQLYSGGVWLTFVQP